MMMRHRHLLLYSPLLSHPVSDVERKGKDKKFNLFAAPFEALKRILTTVKLRNRLRDQILQMAKKKTRQNTLVHFLN